MTRKAIEAAPGGDSAALRLCLERIAPIRKDAPVQFALPKMNSAEDAAKAAGAVLAAVSDGELTPSEASHVMSLIETYLRTLELSELEARVMRWNKAMRLNGLVSKLEKKTGRSRSIVHPSVIFITSV